MEVVSVYKDVELRVNKEENGLFSFELFNSFSKQAELKLIDYLSGNIDGQSPPPYVNSKSKDWLSPFIVPKPAQVQDGKMEKPDDYYLFENLYILGGGCDEDGCNTAIELLNGDKFTKRCKTHITDLAPSMRKPIAKLVGNEIQFSPQDLGSVVLEYIRYPKFAEVAFKFDQQFHEEVADPAKSKNYEWGEYARNAMVHLIADLFSVRNRENALRQHNTLSAKEPNR